MKNLRSLKIAVVLTLSTSMVALAGCSGQTNDDPGESPDRPRIAFVAALTSDPFFRAMRLGAEEEAEKLGVDLMWQGPSDEYSAQKQIPFVEAALVDDVDGLVLVPTDADGLQPSVDKAIAQGIPVVTVDQTVTDSSEVVSRILGDNEDGGQRAAEEMNEQTGGKGKILAISATPTNTTGAARVNGLTDAITANFPELEVLPTQYAESQPDKANSIVNATLLEHNDLAGIFAADGTSCTGAASALENTGTVGVVKLICYDAYNNQVDLLESGAVSALIAQNPAEEGRLAVRYLNAVITGENTELVEEIIILPNVVMNMDNLNETRKYTYAE